MSENLPTVAQQLLDEIRVAEDAGKRNGHAFAKACESLLDDQSAMVSHLASLAQELNGFGKAARYGFLVSMMNEGLRELKEAGSDLIETSGKYSYFDPLRVTKPMATAFQATLAPKYFNTSWVIDASTSHFDAISPFHADKLLESHLTPSVDRALRLVAVSLDDDSGSLKDASRYALGVVEWSLSRHDANPSVKECAAVWRGLSLKPPHTWEGEGPAIWFVRKLVNDPQFKQAVDAGCIEPLQADHPLAGHINEMARKKKLSDAMHSALVSTTQPDVAQAVSSTSEPAQLAQRTLDMLGGVGAASRPTRRHRPG